MNTSHYPSLEQCKKLSLASFPKTTEKVMVYKQLREDYGSHIEDRNGQHTNGSESRIVCPSVMELLDEMPQSLELRSTIEYGENCKYWHMLKIERSGLEGDYNVIYPFIMNFRGTIPNALTEMWLWLKENNYL